MTRSLAVPEMAFVHWPAPAKLNLFLRITGRRPDGYHLLQTLFQIVDLADTLRFTVTEDGQIHSPVLHPLHALPVDQELCTRAARALQMYSDCPLGVRIELDKRIPLGGGLGGGSSDAATTLVALNQLWNLKLDEDCLAAVALRLGADVPVFVRGHTAWAEGVGESLHPVVLPECWYLILAPGCVVDTTHVFQAEDLKRNSPPLSVADFLAGGQGNDCAPVVCRLYPEVAAVMDWLGRFATPRLTGTGACVFAAFSCCEQAWEVCEQLPAGSWRGFVCQGRNRSPLFADVAPER